MTTLLTDGFQGDTGLPAVLSVRSLPAAAVMTGSATAGSGPVKGIVVTQEISPIRKADSPPQGMKFVQIVVLPLLVCVLLVVFLRRHVLH